MEVYRKLYEDNPSAREFILNIDNGLKAEIQPQYLSQAIDNLIINAISYCLNGKITIKLTQENNNIVFVIQDEGIGIPQSELYDIFEEFKVSSKTHTQAGGRGVGQRLLNK